MNICVTDAENGIGRHFAEQFRNRGHEVVSDRGLKLSEVDEVYAFLKKHHPDAVVHCRRVNYAPVQIMKNISACCVKLKIPIMYVSGGSVFGKTEKASERTPRNPVTKKALIHYECENIAAQCGRFYIFRPAENMFGCGGEDIITRLLSLGKRKKEIILNSSKEFSVVYGADAAELGADIIELGKSGIFNCANEGLCSEFSLACELYRLIRLAGNEDYYDVAVSPTETGGHPFEMQCRSIVKAGIEPLESWHSALERYVKQIHTV